MSTHKHIDRICLSAAIFALVLTFLFMNGTALGLTAIPDGDSGDGQFTHNDLDADWDTAGATEIVLTGKDGEIHGGGAYIADGNVHIVCAGKYILSGGLTNGSVIVDASSGDKIWLMLNDVSLHCEDDAALRVEQAGKVFLTLPDGTKSAVSSGPEYRADIVSAGVDGAIYSRDDLTINGSGTLTVTAEYWHGIVCNDDFVITGGTLVVSAVQDGIHANDSARFMDADITINAGDDGVTVSNDDETSYIYIASGSISIPSCYEGLEAISVTIDGGTIHIVPTDDGINANGYGGNSIITINGGDITIINPDGRDADGLDSNGDINITGGKLLISVSGDGGNSAIDYGSENGGVCKISGGTVIACGGTAMAEGFDSSSEQAFLMYATSATAQTTLSLERDDGTVLLSETIPCGFSSVILSTPELRLGDAYTITVGSTREQVIADNSSSSGGFVPAGMFGGMGGGMRGENPGAPDSAQFPDHGEFTGGAPEERPDDIEQRNSPGKGPSSDQAGGMGGMAPDGRGEQPNLFIGNGMGESREQEAAVSTPITPAVLALLGVSVLSLLLGLLIAVKTKH